SSPAIREGRSTTTGPDGLYEFKELPASRYTVTVSKGSYVTLAYGQTRPMQQGRPIELGENQALDKVDVALPRGAVITGRVIDEFGEPVADANVMPMQQRFLPGGRRLTPMGRNSSTNDAGEFRIFGLAPGQYYVGVSVRDPASFGGTENDDR